MKKSMVVLFSTLLLIGILSLCVSAKDVFTLRVEQKTATVGETVELKANIENNTGILAMLFSLEYDTDALELVAVQDGGLVAGSVFGKDLSHMPYKLVWNSASDSDFTEDGTLVTLTFKVLETAAEGKTNVSLSYSPKNVYNVDLKPVAIDVVNGCINVVKTAAGGEQGSNSAGDSGADAPSAPARPSTKPQGSAAVGGGTKIEEDYEVELLAFVDVKTGDWFYENVQFVIENKLMNGTSEETFAPNATLTRAMLVTVLYRHAGEPAVNKSIPFADVASDTYYANAVAWAKQNGIVNGVSENEFAPNANITREQIAAIMYRYAKYRGYSVRANADVTAYADAASIADYALEPMRYVVGSGLIKGKTAATLNPKDYATRAEIAAILQRFIETNK